MTDLRELVKRLGVWHNAPGQRSRDITDLINAVIEERAKVIRVTQRQQGLPEPRVFTVAESKEAALHELNLEGVWPGKEG